MTPLQTQNPYILSLAIANTDCYGEHDDTDSICGTCPIKVSCQAQQQVVYLKLSKELDAADLAAQQAKKIPVMGTPAKKIPTVTSDTSVEDLLADLDKLTAAPVPKAPTVAAAAPSPMDDLFSGIASMPAPTPVKAPTGTGGSPITCPDNLPCQVCKKQMNKGEKVTFLVGKGLKHLTC